MKSQGFGFTVFLASISALTSMSIDMSLPAVPAIEHEFGLAAGRGSLTLSFFLAGYAITPLAGGPLADRFGRRPVLLFGLAVFAISSMACTAAPGFAFLLAFRLLQGCASGVCVALPLAIVRDVLEGHSARQRISEVTTVNGIMPLLAPIAGSSVMLLGGWRPIFAVQGLMSVAIAIFVLLRFTESLPEDRRQRLHPAHIGRNYLLALRQRAFTGYSLMYALNFACIFSFVSASPLLLMQQMGISRHAYTLIFAATVTGTILGSFVSGAASKREQPVAKVIGRGMLLMAAACVSTAALQAAHIQRPISLLPFVFVTLFCFGLTSPAVTMEALEPIPHLAGSGAGAIRSMQMIFGSGASAFLASMCARPGVNAPIVVTFTMSAAALASAALYFASLRSGEHVDHMTEAE